MVEKILQQDQASLGQASFEGKKAEQEQILAYPQLKKIVEALFFVACEPLSLKRLQEICGGEMVVLQKIIDELVAEYQGRGFALHALAGGWQFLTSASLSGYVEKLYRPKIQQLSKAGLETLAIIAYKQPITRLEMENIRQVNVDRIVSKLLEKGLIREVGRKDTVGKPILYGTTKEFLIFFGLDSLDDLPDLQDFLIDVGKSISK
ncbi:MAG: SMC-Scp complex subunit ScpB [Clostridiales bacterium]